MAIYQYTARSLSGEQIAGTIQADNEASVVRTLDEKQLYPIAVVEQGAALAVRGGRKVRLRDLSVFYAQLADLLRAGVPILRALDVISRALVNRRLGQAVRAARDAVADGRTLADALAAEEDVFSELHVAMIRAGESAGFLEDVCTNLAEFLDRQDDLRSKVRGAMIYPIMLTCFGVAAMLFVLIVLVPMFQGVFKGMPLPLPTQIIFAASTFLVDYKWLALLTAGALAGGLAAFLRSERGRIVFDSVKLRAPLIGGVSQAVCITRFCRILGTMLANGIPILKALAISRAAVGNRALERAIVGAAEAVESGEPLGAPLAASGVFPPEIVEMITIAEESNQLEKVLLQIAETVERRTNRKVDQVVRLIEPLILTAIAGVIGFVAAGLLYPIFTMSRTIR